MSTCITISTVDNIEVISADPKLRYICLRMSGAIFPGAKDSESAILSLHTIAPKIFDNLIIAFGKPKGGFDDIRADIERSKAAQPAAA